MVNNFNCDPELIKQLCGNEDNSRGDERKSRPITNYECARKCNIHQLKEIYEKTLQTYYVDYNKYLSLKFSSQASDVANSKEIEPKIMANKEMMNKVLQALRQNISETQNSIDTHSTEIKSKNWDIADRNKNITKQYHTLENRKNELEGKLRMIDTGIERNHYKRNMILFLIVINILIVCTLAGLVIYK
tara:strand:+ start:14713 stop:15279 length:567 start_codon:yes stop_codon:yes gene_type:complete